MAGVVSKAASQNPMAQAQAQVGAVPAHARM